MGYKYSVWLVPNSHRYIKEHYRMEHTPHVTIKTLLSVREAFDLAKTLKRHYYINFVKDIHDLDKIKYKKNKKELDACGFYCNIKNLELGHTPHMTTHYHVHGMSLYMPPPTNCMGRVCIVNTKSNNPSRWYML